MATVTYTATKDATGILQSSNLFDGWTGWDSHLMCGSFTENSLNYTARSVVYFPILFSSMRSITSAFLHLKGGPHTHTGVLSFSTSLLVTRMTKDWPEGQNRGEDIFSEYEQPYDYTFLGEYNSTNIIDILSFPTTPVNFTDYSIDVTDLVVGWFNGEKNYGFQLRSSQEPDIGRALEFYSRHSTGYEPTLVVNYVPNTAPSAPTNLAPTGNALVNSLLPKFTGDRSDADVGDILSAAQVIVYRDNGTSVMWDSGKRPQVGKTFSVMYGEVTPPPVNTRPPVYEVATMIGNTFYKWKARTWDMSGSVGAFTSLQRFKANSIPARPTLIIVQNPDTDLKTLTPSISITHRDPDPGDEKMYGWQAIVKDTLGGIVWDSGAISTSGTPVANVTFVYAGPALAWQTWYSITARTRDSNLIWGPYTEALVFSTHKTAVPIMLRPTNETTSGVVPTFTASVGDDDDAISTYQIILYGPNSQTAQLWDSGPLAPSTPFLMSKLYPQTPLVSSSTYYWKVRFSGVIGALSEYTTLQTFNTPAPAIPVGITPVGQQAVGTGTITPTFTGSRSTPTFDRYVLQLMDASDNVLETTGEYSTGISAFGGSGSQFTKTYPFSYAIDWATKYGWRFKVGTGAGNATASTVWSGILHFTTESAGTAVLTLPSSETGDITDYWVTATPTLTGSRAGSDTIDKVQYRIWNRTGTTMLYQSAMTDVTNGNTFSIVHSGYTLAPGKYQWNARYAKTGGPIGGWSAKNRFYVNNPPAVPTNRNPTPGQVIADTVYPTFTAFFSDADREELGDYPTKWTIVIKLNDAGSTAVATKAITTGLFPSDNSYTWDVGDTGLSYGVDYKWATYFTDSRNVDGVQSSYHTFTLGRSPLGAFTSPSNGSVVATTRPTFNWTGTFYDGKVQNAYRIQISRASDGIPVYDSQFRISAATSVQLQTNLRDHTDYTAVLTLRDSQGLVDSSDSSDGTVRQIDFTVETDAPYAVPGLSRHVNEDFSKIHLEWDEPPPKSGHTFKYYNIYRRITGDEDWTWIATRSPITYRGYIDWWAGQGIEYQYRVTQATRFDDSDLESPDSDIVTAELVSDVWFVVGNDRTDEHVFPVSWVTDEDHKRPVQQEIFEPLGSSRKVIARGFVLGHEGSVIVHYEPDDTLLGRRQVDYLLNNAGPHILKNPFGDVFGVEFAGPEYKYSPLGSLDVTMTYTEITDRNNEIEE